MHGRTPQRLSFHTEILGSEMNHRKTNSLLCLLGMGILFTTGCGSRNLLDSASLGDSFSSSMQKLFMTDRNSVPVSCFSRFEVGKGPDLKGHPGRGLQCWFNFFTTGKAESIKVDGDVRVYVFDNQGTIEEQKKPIHQFDFSAKTWNAYLYNKKEGPTYGVWIPYTKTGNRQAKMTLMLRMTPKVGPVIYSELTTLTLPGAKPKPKKQFAGLDTQEYDLSRSGSVQTMVDQLRRQTNRKSGNPLQASNAKQAKSQRATKELAFQKLSQLLNESMQNGEFARIEQQQANQVYRAEPNPLALLPNPNSSNLPDHALRLDQVQKTTPLVEPRKRFRMTPAPGAVTAKSRPVEPVPTFTPQQVKPESPAPAQQAPTLQAPAKQLTLPAQSNEWHSLDN